MTGFSPHLGTSTPRPRVVVGVDGSPRSIAALRVAVEHARWRDAVVEVVCAFMPSDVVEEIADPLTRCRDTFGPGLVLPPPKAVSPESAARRIAERSVHDAFPDDAPAVPLRIMVRAGKAHNVLIELSRGADLLVVGAPAQSPLRLVSQTARLCARHASCPVIAVTADGTAVAVRESNSPGQLQTVEGGRGGS